MESPAIPNQPLWYEWKQHPKTQAFLDLLRQSVAASQEAWVGGEYNSDDPYRAFAVNGAAIATVQTLEKIIFTVENIKFSDNEDQNAKS